VPSAATPTSVPPAAVTQKLLISGLIQIDEILVSNDAVRATIPNGRSRDGCPRRVARAGLVLGYTNHGKKKTVAKSEMTIHLQLTTIFKRFELGGWDWAPLLRLFKPFSDFTDFLKIHSLRMAQMIEY
jgi:hypothetical protein